MSALSKLMKSKGKTVCGCDDNLSQITEKLNNMGIHVFLGFCEKAIKSCELVVYTNAVKKDNKNLVLAKKLKKPILERAEFLGLLCKEYQTVIAVCGTHGKTTTTAMIAHILKDKNPTVHIGGIAKDFDDNLLVGSNDLFITEACEYNKSFLHINPTHTVCTNIEKDHMDCYKDFDDLKEVFHRFIARTAKNIVINQKFLHFYHDFFANEKIISFSKDMKASYVAANIEEKNGNYSFDVMNNNNVLARINLSVVGEHNVENAIAAFALCHKIGISASTIKQKLESFENVQRRFQVIYKNEVMIVSDYAHHPTEIKASLLAATKIKHNKIICVFQPHTYSRTLSLFDEFLSCFDFANSVIILKTYAAREKEILGGTAHDLFLELKKKNKAVSYFENTQLLFENLQKITQKGDIVLFLGAGTIDQFAKDYVKTYYL